MRPTSDLRKAVLDLRLLYLSAEEIQRAEKGRKFILDMRGSPHGRVGSFEIGPTIAEIIKGVYSPAMPGTQHVCFLVRKNQILSFPFARNAFSLLEPAGPSEAGDLLVICSFSY